MFLFLVVPFVLPTWVKIFRINPEFRSLRLTSLKILNWTDFHRFSDWFQDYLNAINHLKFKLFIFVGILQVLKFEFLKFRIYFQPCTNARHREEETLNKDIRTPARIQLTASPPLSLSLSLSLSLCVCACVCV